VFPGRCSIGVVISLSTTETANLCRAAGLGFECIDTVSPGVFQKYLNETQIWVLQANPSFEVFEITAEDGKVCVVGAVTAG